ncbi:polysaccharide pyruvyl transferase family protein [Reinekea sp.]|jgi:colanic acid/amylovoran biosynthesis protein|uniref:polysaccharide pyruvyl transferase family protein n=1 Tax=Reinekea sp. TaxID=1970455 RepID=UPI002A8148B1|nr:polysaccharide pyruvyl transferase family protein [Reinekea sp.]
MKIIISNIVSLNLGDAAILQGTIATLTEKYGNDVKIIVYDAMSSTASRLYPWAEFKQALFYIPNRSLIRALLVRLKRGYRYDPLRLFRLTIAGKLAKKGLGLLSSLITNSEEMAGLQEYLSADLVVSTGGTYLIENYDLNKNIADYLLTIRLGIRLGFYTQTIGRLTTPYYRKSFHEIFPSAEFIFLRDRRSKNNVIHNGGYNGSNISIIPDAAFKLFRKIPKGGPEWCKSITNIAISVRELRYFDEKSSDIFFNELAILCDYLIANKKTVTFISTCQGVSEYWTDDAQTAQKVISRMTPKYQSKVLVDIDFHQPGELISLYSEFDLVLATRMHAAILSLCAGTLTIGLAYEFKIDELFSSLGLPDYSIKPEHVTAQGLVELIEECDRNSATKRLKQLNNAEKLYQLTDLALALLPNPAFANPPLLSLRDTPK